MEYFVTADDFGNTLSITQAINECILKGWVSNTCLLLNRDASEEAVALAKENDYMDKVHCHLNLSTGHPLTDSIKATPLCNENGEFCSKSNVRVTLSCLSIHAIKAIREECEAQMKLFRSLGFTSHRIDSHMWSMCNIPVLMAIRPLIKKYEFKTTRTLSGHLLNSRTRLIYTIFYKIVQFIMNLLFEVKENWCGCGEELFKLPNTVISSSTIELYVHPDMINNVPTDLLYSYSKERRPVESIVSDLAKYAEHCSLF